MKIILIAGTWYSKGSYEPIWNNIAVALRERFPDAQFVYKQAWYQLWHVEKMKGLSDSILRDEDTGGDILLVGHSMGGIMACGLAPRFVRSRVCGVITVCSPHTLGSIIPALDFHRLIYGTESDPKAPLVSFGGLLDPLVWWMFTRHPKSLRHVYIWSDHRFLLGWRRSIGRKIAKEAADLLAA